MTTVDYINADPLCKWAAMSARYLTWAYTTPIKRTGRPSAHVLRAVLVVLADHANVRGDAWPSVERIARRADLHPSTVRQALGDLEAQALIVATYGRSGGRRPTLWRLPAEASTLAHDEGSTLAHDEGSPVTTLAHDEPNPRPRRGEPA